MHITFQILPSKAIWLKFICFNFIRLDDSHTMCALNQALINPQTPVYYPLRKQFKFPSRSFYGIVETLKILSFLIFSFSIQDILGLIGQALAISNFNIFLVLWIPLENLLERCTQLQMFDAMLQCYISIAVMKDLNLAQSQDEVEMPYSGCFKLHISHQIP